MGPECVEAQDAAVATCAEADRLVQAAREAAEELRAARRQRADLSGAFELVRLGDRQTLRAAKDEAARAYRRDYEGARDEKAVMVATATWLGDVSRLNLDARRAVQEAQTLTSTQTEIDGLVERLDLGAQAARVAAESAAEACVNARRQLAACQEATRMSGPADKRDSTHAAATASSAGGSHAVTAARQDSAAANPAARRRAGDDDRTRR